MNMNNIDSIKWSGVQSAGDTKGVNSCQKKPTRSL